MADSVSRPRDERLLHGDAPEKHHDGGYQGRIPGPPSRRPLFSFEQIGIQILGDTLM